MTDLRTVQRERANKTPSYSKISKDHNNVTICIPLAVKEAMKLKEGQIVSLTVHGDKLTIERVTVIE